MLSFICHLFPFNSAETIARVESCPCINTVKWHSPEGEGIGLQLFTHRGDSTGQPIKVVSACASSAVKKM